jgi:hypothetical protein
MKNKHQPSKEVYVYVLVDYQANRSQNADRRGIATQVCRILMSDADLQQISNPSTSDQVIPDEILRSRIRALIDEKPPESAFYKFLRHPLVVSGFSFILTGLIGWALTTRYEAKQHAAETQRDIQAQSRLALLRGVEDLSQLMYSRQTRASLLYAALNRDAPPKEIYDRKSRYDDSVYEWNANLRRTSFLLRQAEGVHTYSTFESDVQYRLTPMFAAIDGCLTDAYDRSDKHVQVQLELDRCLHVENKKGDISRVVGCIYAISERVYTLVDAGNSELNGDADVPARCPAPGSSD